MGPRSFSYFSALGSEMGGEAEPTQKATLFPSGSALHPAMNGVLKNKTLWTRLFFISITEPFVQSFEWFVGTDCKCDGCAPGAGLKMPTSPGGCTVASLKLFWTSDETVK